jgi:hypothetical protein
VKKIVVDGSEIEVLDYEWREEQPLDVNYYGKLELLPFTIDYFKVKIARQNCKEILQKVLFANEYVIEADNKKAKFYLRMEEMKRLFAWYKSDSDEIEINFIGTGNEMD